MRKSIRVSLLVMVMAVSAYAGDMQCGVTDTPPPQSATAEQEQATTQGSAVSDDASKGTADTLTEIAVSLLTNLLTAL